MATQPAYGAPLPDTPPPPSWPGDTTADDARARWHIGGPREGEWVMRKLAGWRQRLDGLAEQKAEWERQLADWWSDATAELEDSVAWAEGALCAWALEARAADPEQKVQHLPSGKVTTRKNAARVEVADHANAATSLAQARAAAYDDLVTVHARIDVARLNRQARIEDGRVLVPDSEGAWHPLAAGLRVVPERVTAWVAPR